MRKSLIHVVEYTVEELIKIGFPGTIRVIPVSIADTWITTQFLAKINKVIWSSFANGVISSEH